MVLPIHIAAGALAMGGTAAILGVQTGALGNVFAGLMTAYFVITAQSTVRPQSQFDRTEALAADLDDLWCDVLLAMESPTTAHVVSGHSPRGGQRISCATPPRANHNGRVAGITFGTEV
jgi:hypothetical protein